MTEVNLSGKWSLKFVDPRTQQERTLPAEVPGNVELSLIAVEPELYDKFLSADGYETAMQFSMTTWTYERTFVLPADMKGDRLELVFDGIDTAAYVYLNGKELGYVENMFIPHRFDVTDTAVAGDNTLVVKIIPPEVANARHPWELGNSPHYLFNSGDSIRKVRHNWGWDNAPRLMTAGLWRDVTLRTVPKERFLDVYFHTDCLDGDTAICGVDWRVDVPDSNYLGYEMKVTLSYQGNVVAERIRELDSTRWRSYGEYNVKNPKLWWPRGYGDAPLYDLDLVLSKDGEIRATHHARVGIRTFQLKRSQTTDLEGHGEFQFYCNGTKIYVRGTNWKPVDVFASQSIKRLKKSMQLILDCNCNAVRVWGGGYYEPHEFFDFCDEKGLMIWHDFMIACEIPPRNPEYLAEIDKEARYIISEFRNHPSIAIWSGDNEADSVHFWQNRVSPFSRPSFIYASRKILKNAVFDCDPFRQFMESSPYLSDELFSEDDVVNKRWKYINDHAPEQHVYPQFCGEGDFRDFFRQNAAHFVSETGPFYMNAIAESPDLVEREMPRVLRCWDKDNAGMAINERHQAEFYLIDWIKHVRTNSKLFFGEDATCDNVRDLTDRVNIMVSEIFKFVIEYFRQNKWRRTGVIWWSLLDMWPMMFNYSVVDSHLIPKRPFYWITRSQQDVCLMADDVTPDGLIPIHAVNDTLKDAEDDFTVTDIHGKELARGHFAVPANSVSTAITLKASDLPRGMILLKWSRGYNHFTNGNPPWSFREYRDMANALEEVGKKDA